MKNLLTILLFLLSLSLFSQKEADNWYFGRNAGLNFDTVTPTVLLDGQLDTEEGCASISDVNGNLLLYTDGVTIYNRNPRSRTIASCGKE